MTRRDTPRTPHQRRPRRDPHGDPSRRIRSHQAADSRWRGCASRSSRRRRPATRRSSAPIIDANGEPPDFGPSDTGDPIGYLKPQSGDEGGREILAILIEVLDAGYVHVDVGTPEEMYVWPYFARYPVDKLTPPQLVELFKLVFAGDYEDMLAVRPLQLLPAPASSPDGDLEVFPVRLSNAQPRGSASRKRTGVAR